jgi:hypothetical protein
LGIGAEAGGERVLTRAAADDQNSHYRKGFVPWRLPCTLVDACRDNFVDLDLDCA